MYPVDPYGSATPFIDSAIQAIKSGGLLCITCTDMTVLASANFPEVCYAKYGGIPLRARYNHEMALRILLLSLSTTASKYKKYIVPWLSMSVDFYIRVFIRVFEQPSEVKRSLLKTAYVLQSSQTSSFYLQPVGVTRNNNFYGAPFTSPSACQETNGRLIIGGKKYIYGRVYFILIKIYNIYFTFSLLF